MSRKYVAVRSSLTRAVYFRSSGCLKNFESRTFAKIPNDAILSLPGIGSVSYPAALMVNTMYRRGTVAATHVAELPQANCHGTLPELRIRQRVPNGTDLQRPNPGFAGYRGPQLPSKHHGSARRIFPRLAMTPTGTLDKWHSNWIMVIGDFTGFVGAVIR
jgi:hypothetical protein